VLVTLVVAGAGLAGSDWSPLADLGLLAAVGTGTLALVGGGSVYKIAQLRGGGTTVAQRLGGGLVRAEAAGPPERRLLNVVEEMAIASGTPAPPVYLLADEPGINAFAAGYGPGDAVIGVTRGCAERLSRDELQGVVAHEFSHILNGDMRLNIRLMGVLHGILVIGLMGSIILRSLRFRSHGSRRSDSGSGIVAILALGAGLMLVGSIGTFFGDVIKAAVSRQREFLADASAVQFTRNPGGLAGALKKIGGLSAGSRLQSPNAKESSHLFFGQGVRFSINALFATHPPLEKRIRRLEPAWDGSYPEPVATPTRAPAATKRRDDDDDDFVFTPLAAGGVTAGAADSAVEHIGEITVPHLQHARQMIDELPPAVVTAAREPYGARAVVFGLLLSRNEPVREAQRARLETLTTEAERREIARVLPALDTLPVTHRLPLIDLTIPTLCGLSPPQFLSFRRVVNELVHADTRIDFFEWLLERILVRHLEPHFVPRRPPRVRHRSFLTVRAECGLVLSTVARGGHEDPAVAAAAYTRATRRLGVGLPPPTPGARDLPTLDRALDTLARMSPDLKRRFVTAAAACVVADGVVAPREFELLRGVADSLDCPMPPLLPGQVVVDAEDGVG
ncbi:MAG: M48 family metallopeptidase, partial [Phycisphaerales bacterium]|nr:M48 family metallopeptidase [Phycisphaerales bacterium]